MTEGSDAQWIERLIRSIEDRVEPDFVQEQRWFAGKGRPFSKLRIETAVPMDVEGVPAVWAVFQVVYADGATDMYLVPLAFVLPADIRAHERAEVAGPVTVDGRTLHVVDALNEERFCAALFQAIQQNRQLGEGHTRLVFHHVPDVLANEASQTTRRIQSEQSNTSVVFNDRWILKIFRKLAPGLNPDIEIPHYLSAHTTFTHVPPVAGFAELTLGGQTMSVGVMQQFVANQGDGYTLALERGYRYFESVFEILAAHPPVSDWEREQRGHLLAADMRAAADELGDVTGRMHNALALPTDLPEFQPHPIQQADVDCWEGRIVDLVNQSLSVARDRMDGAADDLRPTLAEVVTAQPQFLRMAQGLSVLCEESLYMTRYHGDYHLGQVLETGGSFVVLDFEGEPARSLLERRARHSPLKDVAGMLRSFSYAASAVLLRVRQGHPPEIQMELERWADVWEQSAREAFVEGYRRAARDNAGLPYSPAERAAFERATGIFEVEKALYELNYEFNNRPDWASIPARGLVRLLHTAGV